MRENPECAINGDFVENQIPKGAELKLFVVKRNKNMVYCRKTMIKGEDGRYESACDRKPGTV